VQNNLNFAFDGASFEHENNISESKKTTVKINRYHPAKSSLFFTFFIEAFMDNLQILRIGDVSAKTGLSKSMVYKLIKADDFPKPVQLSARAVGWDADLINGWLANKLGKTGGAM
jgi:prophage regulatory protein